MTVYVKIDRLKSMEQQLILGNWLLQVGITEVNYSHGGWYDNLVNNTSPHLKFKNEEDAIVYVLAHGGKISRTIPEMIPGVDCALGG